MKCPNCGNDLGSAADAYMYGSPFRICNQCRNYYVDRRYHEIAVEGIRPEDIDPAVADKQEHRKAGMRAIWIGVGMIVLFVLILFTGWIIFPLPIFGVIGIISGVRAMKHDGQKELEKTKAALEIERQQSELRMQDPQYVERLRSIGYLPAQPIPADDFSPSGEPMSHTGQMFCAQCGNPLNANDQFCARCGTHR